MTGITKNSEIIWDDAINLKNEGAIFVDVRSMQEYEEGHVVGAINIPSYEIKNKIRNIIRNKNEIIILYCSTGERSRKAYKILKNMGFFNVYYVVQKYK